MYLNLPPYLEGEQFSCGPNLRSRAKFPVLRFAVEDSIGFQTPARTPGESQDGECGIH